MMRFTMIAESIKTEVDTAIDEGRLERFHNAFKMSGMDDNRLYQFSSAFDYEDMLGWCRKQVRVVLEGDQYSTRPYRIVRIEEVPKEAKKSSFLGRLVKKN